MVADCISMDLPLAYFSCAGLRDIESRSFRIETPRRIFVQAGGRYGPLRDWVLCEDLPLPVYNDFVSLISNRNPGKRGKFWEIGGDGKARLVAGVAMAAAGRLEVEFVEFLRLRARAGRALWVSQAIVGSVAVVDIAKAHPSSWAESGCWHWVLDEPLLFEEPILGIQGRPGVFQVEIPDELPRAVSLQRS